MRRILTTSLVTAAALSILATASMPAMAAAPNERIAQRMADRCTRMNERLAQIDRGFTADQIRDIAAGRLAQAREKNLKVGKVTPKADGVVTLEIVTLSGSLVETYDISTKTGLPANLGQNCQSARTDASAGPAATDRPDRPGRPGRPQGFGREGTGRFAPGNMGPGRDMGPGRMGRGMPDFGMPAAQRGRDLNLNADQVRKLADAGLIMRGNPRLKVGNVKEKDADTFTVEIVTKDNALVTTREVNRHTGRSSRVN